MWMRVNGMMLDVTPGTALYSHIVLQMGGRRATAEEIQGYLKALESEAATVKALRQPPETLHMREPGETK